MDGDGEVDKNTDLNCEETELEVSVVIDRDLVTKWVDTSREVKQNILNNDAIK